MSAPTNAPTTDLAISFDPTGYTVIDGAQLNQLVTGAYPVNGIGFVVVTADSGLVPNPPNANVTTKWTNYIWLRVGATTLTAYVWNPAGPATTALLNWQTISSASIGPGTIIGSMIAANTIPATAIISLTYAQLTGAPALATGSTTALTADGLFNTQFFNSNIFVWGDLQGSGLTPGTPVVAPLAITAAKIAANTITTAQLANNSHTASTELSTAAVDIATNISVPTTCVLGSPSNVNFVPGTAVAAGDILAVNCDATGSPTANTGLVLMRKAVLGAAEPAVQTYNQLPVCLAGATTYTLSNTNTVGRVLQTVAVVDNSVTSTSYHVTNSSGLPNAIPVSGTSSQPIAALVAAITPINAGSKLIIDCTLNLAFTSAETPANLIAALFISAGAGASTTAIAANFQYTQYAPNMMQVRLTFAVASSSTAARTYQIGFGSDTASTTFYNSLNGSTKPFGGTLGVNSYLNVTEYL